MEVVILTSFFTLFLTYLSSKNVLKYGMLIGFVLLTIIQGLRYDYGNDYANYLKEYEWVSLIPISWDNVANAYYDYNIEPGWFLMHQLFSYLGGFFSFVFFVSLIQNVVYYSFISNNVLRKHWPVAVFLYLFTQVTGYLINMTMMRQGLAVALFLLAYPFIRDKKWLPAIVIVLIASSIHISALILIPFCFFGSFRFKQNKIIAISLLVAFVVSFFSSQLLKDVLSQFFKLSAFERFQNYEYSEAGALGFGNLLQLIPCFCYIYCLYSNNNLQREEKLIIVLSFFYAILLPFSSVIDLASRVGYYFYALSLSCLPMVYSTFKKDLKVSLYVILVAITLFSYARFFSPPSIYAPFYTKYRMIFEVL